MEHQATMPRPDNKKLELYKCIVQGESESIRKFDLQPPPESTSPKDTVLHFAVKLRQIDCIKEILKLCPWLVRCQNSKGDTALHIAARNGLDDIVELLINQTKLRSSTHEDIEGGREETTDVESLIRTENKKKDTAVHEAVRNHHLFNGKREENYLKVLKLLTEADRKFKCCANDAGETPLYLAAEEGLSDFVRQIWEACPFSEYGGPYGRTALHAALFGRHKRIVLILLEKMSSKKTQDLIGTADNDKRTPLHFAASYAYTSEIVEELLLSDMSLAYEPDKDGILPVHLAAQRVDPTLFLKFFEHCPDCLEHVDNRGRNALHYAAACIQGLFVLHTVLISDSNYLLKGMVNEVDNDGNTPLHVAVKCGNFPAVDMILRSCIVDKFAIDNDCFDPVDIMNKEKNPFKRFYWATIKKIYWKRLRTLPKLRRQKMCEKPDGEIKEDNKQSQQSEYKKERNETHLLVAALVATVTFAAGFTMPGGHNEVDGTAILATKVAFQAFVILNSLSMSSAVAAVFLHFWATFYPRSYLAEFLPALSARLIVFACLEMVAAFMAGTFVVLRHCQSLAVSVCCICCIFYLCVVICLVLPKIVPILLIVMRWRIWFYSLTSRRNAHGVGIK